MDALAPSIIQLLGVDFSNVSQRAVIKRLLARPPAARFSYVVTPNADHMERLLRISGSARAILRAERVALNIVQHLSGIATLTAQFVAAVKGTRAQILATRKPTPGWRRPARARRSGSGARGIWR